MKTLFTLVLLLTIGCSTQAAANSFHDSVYRFCMKSAGHDTDKIKCLDLKSFEISNSNPIAGLFLAQKALHLSQGIKWQKGIALAHNEIAVNYTALGELDSAARHYHIALQNFNKIGNLKAESGVMTNISFVYKSKGDFVKALKYLNKALTIQEKSNKHNSKAITLENIGSVYLDLKEFEKAKHYYLKARSIYYKNKDSNGIARNMVNLGIIYDKNGYYDSAVSNLESALLINLKLNRLNSTQIAYANLGIVYTHKKDYTKSIYYHKKAIEYSKILQSDFSLAIDYGNLGEAYLEKYKQHKDIEDLNKAKTYLSSGYTMCRKMGFAPPQIEFGEKLLECLEIMGGDYKLAYQVYAQKTHLKDSIYSKDNSLRIYKLETESAITQKENELRISRLKSKLDAAANKKFKQEKTNLILLVVILLMSICLLYLLYLNRRRIHKKHMHEISQFQSHQIRSPVVKIITLLDAIQNPDIDKNEIDKLMDMLSSSAKELDQRIHEIVERTN